MIGVITAHTEAPREFSDDEVDFLVTSASLVASAIENARLYEEARLRVAELEQLTELAEAIARAGALEELLQTVVSGARPLLAARACHVYLLDPGSEELERVASDPEPGNARDDARPGGARARARARRTEHAGRGSARGERRADRAPRRRGQRPRRARPHRREPGRGRSQEGPGHRAADGEEPDQGLLRGARRRPAARRSRGTRGPARLRSVQAARRPRRRAARTMRSSARSGSPPPARSSIAESTPCGRS